jgi:hypothetical protein
LALWDQPALAKSVTVTDGQGAAAAVRQLEGMNLPIGWTQDDKLAYDNIFSAWPWDKDFGWWVTTILGWLITAGATLFGAPFWYDTLQQFVRLKGAGPSPAEKAQQKGASA